MFDNYLNKLLYIKICVHKYKLSSFINSYINTKAQDTWSINICQIFLRHAHRKLVRNIIFVLVYM